MKHLNYIFLKKESFSIYEVLYTPAKIITCFADLLKATQWRSLNKPESVITDSSRACLSWTCQHHSRQSTWVAWEPQLHRFRERLRIAEFHVCFYGGDLVLRSYSRVFILLHPWVCVLLSLKWKEWLCGLVLRGKQSHRIMIQCV